MSQVQSNCKGYDDTQPGEFSMFFHRPMIDDAVITGYSIS